MVAKGSGVPSARQREFFPLPIREPVELEHFAHLSLSRCQRRRIASKCKSQNWLSDALQALNEISGAPYSDPGSEPRNASQFGALDHSTTEFGRRPKPPSELSGAGAFAELCETT